MRNGMNTNDLLGYAIGSPDRTKNLERLIWATTGLFALVIGSLSAVAIIASQYRVAGSVGLAAAVIAVIAPATAIWRRLRRQRRAGKP